MPAFLLGNRDDWRENVHAFNNPPPSTRPKKKHFWKRGSATLPQVALNVAQHTFSDLALNADSIKSPCIDFILPFRINEYQLLADCAVARRKSVFPDAALAKKIEDKLEFSKLLLALGFSDCVPKIGRPSNMRLPIICKKRIGENGANMRVLCSEAELSQAETAEYFFQEYAPGPEEYATHSICVRGQTIFSATYKYHFNRDIYSKSANCHPVHVAGWLHATGTLGNFVRSGLLRLRVLQLQN